MMMPALLRALLFPLSLLYALAVTLRSLLYDQGLLRTRSVGVTVLSVGSVSVGGAGKTPLVIWLVERCRRFGLRPVVVSRGYRGPTKEPTVIESGSRRGADEALLVAARTGCPVVTGRDRVAACRLAIERFSPDLVILDDGFQHRRLARDIDLVIAPMDEDRGLLPSGSLREPRAAMDRAHLVVSTGTGTVGLVRDPSDRDAEAEPAASLLEGQRVLAVAGIAKPAPFIAALEGMGSGEVEALLFPDHHDYRPADIASIRMAAIGRDLIVTTEKDLVKLRGANLGPARLFALRVVALPDKAAEIDVLLGRLDRKPGG